MQGFAGTSSRSSLETVDPQKFTSYLCGYKVRTCTLYIIWLEVFFLCAVSLLIVLIRSYVHVDVIVEHKTNETKYTFRYRNESLVVVDLWALGKYGDINFIELGKKLLQLTISIITVDFVFCTLGLLAIYRENHRLLLPYLITLTCNILLLVFYAFFDILFLIWEYVQPVLWLDLVVFLLLLQKTYKFFIVYSYFFHCDVVSETQVKFPTNLTTESPIQYPPSPLRSEQFKLSVLNSPSRAEQRKQSIPNSPSRAEHRDHSTPTSPFGAKQHEPSTSNKPEESNT